MNDFQRGCWRAWFWVKHPLSQWRHRKHARRYPKVGQVIRYHDTLVRVIDTNPNRDDVQVRWFDNNNRYTEWVSWLHCCELP